MNKRADFLLEIGCEEIPARMIRHASEELKDRKSTRLNSSHIQKSRMPSSA